MWVADRDWSVAVEYGGEYLVDDVAVMAPRKRSNTLPGTFTVPAAAAAADDDDDDNDDEPVQPDDDCHIADNDGLLLYTRVPMPYTQFHAYLCTF